ncbi:hypothetical protein [Clostridium culturomicium]|uniref:hypothetical protein n=1 Tax=Clostridium culturomicium TaxID=1499683 RepID=UPI00058B8C0F|nr:hypothetical protein [Clostridium culturomicium]
MMKALTHDEFVVMMKKRFQKKEQMKKLAETEYNRYIFAKKYECSKKDALHERRQPHWKNK